MTLVLVAVVLLFWGVAGIFDKKAVSVGGHQSVFTVFQLFNLPVLVVMFALLTSVYGQWHLDGGLFFWEGLNAVSALAAMLAYFYAMSKAQASYIIGITAGYPVLGKLLAMLILGEAFSAWGIAGAALVSVGVAAIGFSKDNETVNLAGKESWKVIAAIAVSTVLWALLGIFEKKALQYGRPLEAYTVLTGWKSLLALLYLFFSAKSLSLRQATIWKFSWSSALLVTLGNLAFIFALAAADAGYVIVMTAAYPLVMYLAAIFWLKERLLAVRALGIALIVFGCALSELCR